MQVEPRLHANRLRAVSSQRQYVYLAHVATTDNCSMQTGNAA